jgi:DNA-binding NarL/FixJ family response regulator
LKATSTNILIIDTELEGLHGSDSLKKIIQENPYTKIFIYTCASEKLFGVTSLKARAACYISKYESLENLEKALLTIADGQTIFSSFVHKSILTSARLNENERMHR